MGADSVEVGNKNLSQKEKERGTPTGYIFNNLVTTFQAETFVKTEIGKQIFNVAAEAFILSQKLKLDKQTQQYLFQPLAQAEDFGKLTAEEMERSVREKELYDRLNNSELSQKTLAKLLQDTDYIHSMGLDPDNLQPFDIRVINVPQILPKEGEVDEYRQELSQIRKNPNILQKKFNPHCVRYEDGSTVLILGEKDAQNFIESELESVVPSKKTKRMFREADAGLIKHEFYHTQKVISFNRLGCIIEELCAEQASGNTQGYKDIKYIWTIASKLYGFDPKILTEAVGQSDPLQYLISKLVNSCGPILTQFFIALQPVQYQSEKYDLSEMLLKIAEAQLGHQRFDAVILQEAEKAVSISQKSNGFMTPEGVASIPKTYGLNQIADRIGVKVLDILKEEN
ncbi:MAG: hypothetical protein OHK0017_10600 [Patescibacteria group bacterium]